MPKIVLIAGSTGLVGSHLLPLLQAHPSVLEIRVAGRRAPAPLPSKAVFLQTDFSDLHQHRDWFDGVAAVFCALGTTIKTAGSQEQFRKVDYSYPLELARMARECGVPAFGLVSALGADAASKVFYNRVKGELERDMQALGLTRLCIARPSLLLGERAELRVGERIGKLFTPVVPGSWKPVHARQVARALLQHTLNDPAPGVHILENKTLLTF